MEIQFITDANWLHQKFYYPETPIPRKGEIVRLPSAMPRMVEEVRHDMEDKVVYVTLR